MLTFIHDHIFFKRGDRIYSSSSFPYSIWERYTKIFGNITVVGRLININTNIENYPISSGPEVNFHFITSYNRARNLYIKTKQIYNELKDQILISDRVIIRLPSRLGVLGYLICKKYDVPYLVEVVGNWSDVIRVNKKNIETPFVLVFNILMKLSIKESSHVIYVTDKYLQKSYPTNNKSIGISDVKVLTIKGIEKESKLLQILSINTTSNINIGMIGDLSMKYKGYDVALETIKLISQAGINVTLHLVGGGSTKNINKLAKELKIEKNIRIIGPLKSGPEIFSFLDNMHFFFQVSYVDSMPRALLEAMSRGCVCFGSDVGDMPYILDNKFIIKRGDSIELFEKTLNIIKNPNHGYKSVLKNLTIMDKFSDEGLNNTRACFFLDFLNLSIKA